MGNGNEITFTVEFLALFLQKPPKMHKSWPPNVFLGRGFEMYVSRAVSINERHFYAHI